METKKIRIGNDIRLAVNLRQFFGNTGEIQGNEQDSTEEFYSTESKLSIRSVKAKFINTTRREEEIKAYKKRNRFMSRFPVEPGIEQFHSTQYDICNSGWYSWRFYPKYNGYGINPNFDWLHNPIPMTDDTEYIADVTATSKQHIIEVTFPAEHQHHIGKYTLILVVKAFAPGYNEQNVKTFTVDVPDVIELVKTTEEGSDTGVIVNVSIIKDRLPEGDDYAPSTSDVFVDDFSVNGNIITIHRTDQQNLSIDIADKIGWYEGD